MRLSLLLAVTGASVLALPNPQASPNVGECPTACWNESAAQAGCDPNVDDACLCGIFFDLVTTCVSETCSIEDNFATLDFLEPACA